MTLEERVGKLEVRSDELRDIGIDMSRGALAITGEVSELKAQLAELDVMVMAIHATIKDVQAKVTEQ